MGQQLLRGFVMSGIRPVLLTEPVANEVAAVLRHDLVTPINIIIGYCDLLLSEVADSPGSGRAAPLRTIRTLGFGLLNSIDETLLADQPNRSVGDLRKLAATLEGPVGMLIERCDALEVASRSDEVGADFIEDLQRVRAAGVRMLEMAHEVAMGRFPGAD